MKRFNVWNADAGKPASSEPLRFREADRLAAALEARTRDAHVVRPA